MKKKFASFVIISSLFTFVASPLASGHAELEAQNPGAGSIIELLPATIELTFGEDLIQLGKGNELQVLDPNGDEVTTGEVRIVGSVLSRALKNSVIEGDYYISYRAVSEDGHVVAGESGFTLSTKQKVTEVEDKPTATKIDNSNIGVPKTPVVVSIAFLAILLLCLLYWRSLPKK